MPRCPNCLSGDLKDGAVTEDLQTYDYRCRDCQTVFDAEDAA